MGSRRGEFDNRLQFTKNKPVIFQFACCIFDDSISLTYRRTYNHATNFHVRGCKEKGNINTPLELAIL